MADWLGDHPELYNKKLNDYTYKVKKDAAWAEQTARLDNPVAFLMGWYRSIRTRYGKLTKMKWLATQTTQETEDEAECMDIELEGGVARGLEDGPAIGCDDPAVGSAPATATRSRPSLSPDVMPMLPVRPNRSAARAQTDEDKLLATLEERGRQSMELQNKLINLIKPEKPANEREAYGDWAKSVMVGLHPTLWRQFQAEQSVLLARYLEFDDRA